MVYRAFLKNSNWNLSHKIKIARNMNFNIIIMNQDDCDDSWYWTNFLFIVMKCSDTPVSICMLKVHWIFFYQITGNNLCDTICIAFIKRAIVSVLFIVLPTQ